MKFETINNQLCRMVEPEPLTPEANFPCVVRLIQDDSPMGRNNDFYATSHLLAHIEIINGLYAIHFVGWQGCKTYYSRFEIIGYPVADGSLEWAWYQRCVLDVPVIGPNGVKPNNRFTLKQWCNQYCLLSMKTGWQLYEPEPLKAGDWVTDGAVQGRVVTRTSDTTWVEVQDGKQYHIETSHLHKLAPSEVRVKVVLEGTVKPCSVNTFELCTNEGSSWIGWKELDLDTAELVKALLKAQEGE